MSSFRVAGSELTGTATGTATAAGARFRTGSPADTRPGPGAGRSRRTFAASTAPAPAAPPGTAPASAARGQERRPGSPEPDFGPNVRVFGPATPAAEIQAALDAAARRQDAGGGFAFLFRPGTYDVDARLGSCTSIAGLGLSPDDVTINGAVRVEGRPQPGGGGGALTALPCSAENLAVGPADGTGRWAVSQAAPPRRVHIRGQLLLPPRRGGSTSGGHTADPAAGSGVVNASQQPGPTRGSTAAGRPDGVRDQIFRRFAGAPGQPSPQPPCPAAPAAPVSREKPFLHLDAAGRYRVFLPALRYGTADAGRSAGRVRGTSVPIEQFFVAKPADSVVTLNRALAQGKHLLLTPGVYRLTGTLKVTWSGTVVLGLGFPTLVPVTGAVAMRVENVRGVRVAGLLFDAAGEEPPALLEIGGRGRRSDPRDPTSVQDVFFRVGAGGPGRTGNALVVGSDDVLIDHVRAWHADRPGAAAPVDVVRHPSP
ncbi:coagulation factor 5/8 type domain-containing protein [Streptomyces sp. NPDC020983]|uniref:coagulation factor 5/8 type domain-containing protein n=1 Tax=Streptomyces sp. NPDC020983 TaxID=3365106 RepID=UPI0037946545